MCATYRDKQKRSHFESFANKIFTGIREIKPEYAEKRAIWELFQNALDTVSGNGIIEIAKTQNGLLFKHNGRPFKDDEFGGLIKQISVGKTYGDNSEKLGQYGTGFISTHVYGKKILVNGSIQTDDGTYRILHNFLLDRDSASVNDLTDKLLQQDEHIEDLCDSNKNIEANPLSYISFEYQAEKDSILRIDRMLDYLESILPYIFCFNEKLTKVVLTKYSTQEYVRTIKSGVDVEITKNGQPIHVPYIQNDDSTIKVIIGSSDRCLNNVPKQFLYYPLMETEAAGYNFLIHASEFKPNKERDYLYKDRSNIELKGDVALNEKLLSSGFDLVLENIINDKSLSIIEVSKIEFKESDSDFEKKIKTSYINIIKDLKRFKFNEIEYSLTDFKYFSESILLLSHEVKDSIYKLLCQFRILPPLEIYYNLSCLINNWNNNNIKFEILSINEIAKIVADESGGNYYYIHDKKSFTTFISLLSENITLLNDLALVPNLHGDFRRFENLVKWDIDEPDLVRIVDNLNLSISDKYIHQDFKYLPNIASYNREKFKEEFSKFCTDLADDLSKVRVKLSETSTRFCMLVQYLTDFIALNKKTQLNIDVVEFYVRVFGLIHNDAELNNPTINLNYHSAIKSLANLYIKTLEKIEIKNNINDLSEIISKMFTNINLKEELLYKLVCLPDQNYVLKSQPELKRDDVIDEDFKNKFDTITSSNIRSQLAFPGFEGFLQHPGSVTGYFLGGLIETALNKERKFIPVENETIDTVLQLIEKISERPGTWGQWLPNINGVKEEILMHKFKNEKTRSSLFSILTKKEETIELLGDLANIDNLKDLIKKGKEWQLAETRNNSHLEYISYIGLTIQDIIQKQLDVALAHLVLVLKSEEDKELVTKEEQNGQDFIIYKNNQPIYFLEVKSKWDENGRFSLSKNQTEKCASEKKRYAVISVNVDRYKRENRIDFDNIPFEHLKPFIKVNNDLGEEFEKLVLENLSKNEANDPKLVEFRGSIPQKRIDTTGLAFDDFLEDLIKYIKAA
jgi:hypothetical protein